VSSATGPCPDRTLPARYELTLVNDKLTVANEIADLYREAPPILLECSTFTRLEVSVGFEVCVSGQVRTMR
jgi:hypothetical protein